MKQHQRQLHLDHAIESPATNLSQNNDDDDDDDATRRSMTIVDTNFISPLQTSSSVEGGVVPTPSHRKNVSSRLDCPSQEHRDVCHPRFGSWCDDSSTDEDNENSGDNENSDSDCGFDSDGNIVVSISALGCDDGTHDDSSYTSFYVAHRMEDGFHTNEKIDEEEEEEEEEDQGANQEENEERLRLERKQQHDEGIVSENLQRRLLTFLDTPRVQEFEPAPRSCYGDLYYSAHQLQRMMDAYYRGEQLPDDSPDD